MLSKKKNENNQLKIPLNLVVFLIKKVVNIAFIFYICYYIFVIQLLFFIFNFYPLF